MVRLTELGYVQKPHTSAGRIPTPAGMKFYVSQLMKEKDLSVAEEVALKERLWDYREQEQKFMRELARSLAERTKALALVTTADGEYFVSGYANILDMPEFFDIDLTKSLLSCVDEAEFLQSIFSRGQPEDDVHVLIGEELAPQLQGPYGFVFTRFETPMHRLGEVGVVGP